MPYPDRNIAPYSIYRYAARVTILRILCSAIMFAAFAGGATIPVAPVVFSGSSVRMDSQYLYSTGQHSGGDTVRFDLIGTDGFRFRGEFGGGSSSTVFRNVSALGCSSNPYGDCSGAGQYRVYHDGFSGYATSFRLATNGEMNVLTDSGDTYVVPLITEYVYSSFNVQDDSTPPYVQGSIATTQYVFSAVPEPGTVLLSGMGLVVVGWRRLQRKREK